MITEQPLLAKVIASRFPFIASRFPFIAPNVVPGEARLTVEWRSGRPWALRSTAAHLAAVATWAAAAENCTATVEQCSSKPVAEFDTSTCELLEGSCGRAGAVVGNRLLSYAGHDASVLSRYVPTAMLFVPSAGGISHSPRESTPVRQLVLGCQALLRSVIEAHRQGRWL